MWRRLAAAGLLMCGGFGCNASNRPTSVVVPTDGASNASVQAPDVPKIDPTEPISLQLRDADPALNDVKFNPILSFEAASDRVFTTVEPTGASEIDSTEKFTGRSSLKLSPGARLTFRLPALLGARGLSGTWNLIGPYVRVSESVMLVATYRVDDLTLSRRSLRLKPGQWKPVLLNLPASDVVGSNVGQLVIEPAQDSKATLWVDDLLLLDNRATLIDTTDDEKYGWRIERNAFTYVGDAPGRFKFTLSTPEATPQGWTLVESNAMRCRFVSTGKQKSLSVYSDGRAFWDGQFKPMSKLGGYDTQLAEQHTAPGEMAVPEDQGRVDRTSAGDRNNDGYNETRGTYMAVANNSRIEAQLSPQGTPLYRPILEITGLPPGPVLATVEGRLIDRVIRTQDGTVLIDVPVKIERATVINVRVQ